MSGPSAVPAGTTSTGGTGPDAVLVLYRRLETLYGAIGLAGVIRPVGALLTANVRDPQRFGDAALRLDQAHAFVVAIKSAVMALYTDWPS